MKFDNCNKCMGAGVIVGVITTSILHCPIYDKHQECPYVPNTQHIHQEIYNLPSLPSLNMDSTVASATNIAIDHDSLIHRILNPDGEGYINFIDISSRDNLDD